MTYFIVKKDNLYETRVKLDFIDQKCICLWKTDESTVANGVSYVFQYQFKSKE